MLVSLPESSRCLEACCLGNGIFPVSLKVIRLGSHLFAQSHKRSLLFHGVPVKSTWFDSFSVFPVNMLAKLCNSVKFAHKMMTTSTDFKKAVVEKVRLYHKKVHKSLEANEKGSQGNKTTFVPL